jgi:hypothetical protein
MAKKADADKVAEKELSEAMGNIETAAAAAYSRDQQAAAEAEHVALVAAAEAAGVWEWDAASGYYYNERHRWYYDPKTKWYYGGEPVAWAELPPAASLPAKSRFGTAPHTGGPAPPYKRPETGSTVAAAGGGGGGAGASGGMVKTVKKVIALPQHPQALIGGHQMHHVGGKIGGAKGVGSGADAPGDDGGKVSSCFVGWVESLVCCLGSCCWGQAACAVGGRRTCPVPLPLPLVFSRATPAPLFTQRKREQGGAAAAGGKGGGKGGGKPADPAEAAALARREAARQRVQQRTQQSFGLS